MERRFPVVFLACCGVLAACGGTSGATNGSGSPGADVPGDAVLDGGGAGGGDGSAANADVMQTDLGMIPRFDVPARADVAAAGDAGAEDAVTLTTLPDGAVTGCTPRERCGNGLDDDCDGTVDDGCPCIPGSDEPCFPGDPARAGVGVCVRGTQHCTGTGEFGTWGACTGAGAPRAVDCTMPTLDTRCDGHPGVSCVCRIGMTRSCYTGPDATAGRGLCHTGTQACAATATGSDWGPCTGQVLPAVELCDGRDENCDGIPNSGCGCMMGATRPCYDGPAGTSGRGLCHGGTQTCAATAGGTTSWGLCVGEVLPARDVCNGMDRDCDGNPNTGCACTIDATRACYTGPAGTAGVGPCRAGTQTCNASIGTGGVLSSAWGTCLSQRLPGPAEICGNGIDDNCNGMVDELCTPGCTAGMTRCAGVCVDTRSDAMNCGACGNVCPAGQACANGVCVGNGMLRITMVWDVAGDMDLQVIPPCGMEISYRTTMNCGGQLDHDDIVGTGPENIFWAAAPARGTYLVCATPYGIGGTTNATITVNQGTTVVQTWRATRTARSGYVLCSTSSPYYVGSFVY